jgi:hypothetical protein
MSCSCPGPGGNGPAQTYATGPYESQNRPGLDVPSIQSGGLKTGGLNLQLHLLDDRVD